MAGIACSEIGPCSDIVKNVDVLFTDQTEWPAGATLADLLADENVFSLPSYAQVTRSTQTTEAIETRYSGRRGHCGDFGAIGSDSSKKNWVILAPFCMTDPAEAYLQQGECWNMRFYPDRCNPGFFYQLSGSISYTGDSVYDGRTNQDTLIEITLKGFSNDVIHVDGVALDDSSAGVDKRVALKTKNSFACCQTELDADTDGVIPDPE